MTEPRERINEAAQAICDGFRQIGDISYAILPSDIAHALGDLKKAFLGNIRSLVDWEIEWITDRVAGGDKLREEWKEKCHQGSTSEPPPEPIS
jgi:hypothetical protein